MLFSLNSKGIEIVNKCDKAQYIETKMRRAIILLAITIILYSCSKTQICKSAIAPRIIDTLLLLPPVSHISLIENGNRQFFDKKMSKFSSDHLAKGIKEILDTQMVVLNLNDLDSITNIRLKNDAAQLINVIERSREIRNITIPVFFDSILKLNRLNYAMCIYHSGFTRSGGNYTAHMAAGIALGLLGGFAVIPIKAYSTVYCVILDSKNKNITFYRKCFKQDWEPADKRITDKQLNLLFKGYFRI